MLGTMVSRYFLNLKEYDVALTTRAPGQESDESYIFKYDASVDEVDSLIQKVNPDYVINCIGINIVSYLKKSPYLFWLIVLKVHHHIVLIAIKKYHHMYVL